MKTSEFKTECDICGVTGGERIARLIQDHLVWSGNPQGEGWTPMHVVRIVQKAGLCEACYLARRNKP